MTKLGGDLRAGLLFAIALLLSPVAANAGTCPLVDYDNSPETTVSGRITMHHSVPKGGDLRAAKGFPFLKLDKPLLASVGGRCVKWDKIVVFTTDDAQLSRFRRSTNRRVTIEGKLDRWGSALVDPAIFITPTTVTEK